MKFFRNLWHKIDFIVTGIYYPFNQCEATKRVSPSCEVACTKFRDHYGRHSFEEKR